MKIGTLVFLRSVKVIEVVLRVMSGFKGFWVAESEFGKLLSLIVCNNIKKKLKVTLF